jgi:hypothetical protein
LPLSVQKAMKDGNVCMFMDSLQVVLILGEPIRIKFRNKDRQMVFYYPRIKIYFTFSDKFRAYQWERNFR